MNELNILSPEELEEMKLIEGKPGIGIITHNSPYFPTITEPFFSKRASPVKGCDQVLILFLGIFPAWINMSLVNIKDAEKKYSDMPIKLSCHNQKEHITYG